MSTEISIPLGALSMQDEGDKTVAPEIGDPVDFNATGTVTRVDGENAYVTLESVNGEPLPEPVADPLAAGDGRDALMSQANTFDAGQDEM